MKFSPLIAELIKQLKILPGVGNKSAQRMAFQLLEGERERGLRLSQALHDAMQHVTQCQRCRTFTETQLCEICASEKRSSKGVLCVVESPQDILAIESSGEFLGCYFVLHGRLSPIDGIGPAELGLQQLESLLQSQDIQEVILATNATLEGEATAHYVADLCRRHGITASRIAQGVPVGGELEFIDGSTLVHAFQGRKDI